MPTDLIHAHLDRPFSVTVVEDASTGYVWRVAADSSEQFTLVDEGLIYEDASHSLEDMRVGGQHVRTLQFQAHTLGTHRLRLEHGRFWLAADSEAVIHERNVVVS